MPRTSGRLQRLSNPLAQRQCPIPPLDPEANAREELNSAIAPIAFAVASPQSPVHTGQAIPPVPGLIHTWRVTLDDRWTISACAGQRGHRAPTDED